MLRFKDLFLSLGCRLGGQTHEYACVSISVGPCLWLSGQIFCLLLKMSSVSVGYGTPACPHFLDSCKSWFIPEEHIFPQMLTGHESKPSSTPRVLRIHDPRLFQSKPWSLFSRAPWFWEVLGFMESFTDLAGKLQSVLCTNVLRRGFRQMLFPTVATYSVLYI